MFHQSHASIAWPAFPVVVADDVLIVRVRMFRQVTLDQISCFLRREPAERNATCIDTHAVPVEPTLNDELDTTKQNVWEPVFRGWMIFFPLKQQCKSTEGNDPQPGKH